jgi:16S rRNA (guanine527-N7)-methyltransferase
VTALATTLAELALPADLRAPLAAFATLFHKWNQRINLSASRDEAEIGLHVADCLHLVPFLRSAIASWRLQPAPVLDVGAGGGFPAVVVAICLPEAHVTALEPVHKKHAFLRTAARELALGNLTPLAERVETHARRNYAAATSRATLDLRDWLLLGLDRIEPGGSVFGFEATPRDDLPGGTARHPYLHQDRQRAIVSLQRLAT